MTAPPSKSYTHRAFALALLAKSPSTIRTPLLSRDTLATIDACRRFGGSVEENGSIFRVSRAGQLNAPDNVLNVENSGTTIRMMMSIASLTAGGFTILTGDSSVRERPMGPLLVALNQLGVDCWSTRMDGTPPIIVKGGGMEGGEVEIRGDVSSQFISSLVLSCPLARKDSTITVKGNLVSRPYVDATVEMIKRFGGDVAEADGVYLVQAGDYLGIDFLVPSDFSSASFMLTAAAITGGEVEIEMSGLELPQADAAIVGILRKMGVDVRDLEDGKGLFAKSSSDIVGGNFDLSSSPDLLPVLAVLALKSKTPVRITGVAHARFKEIDRVAVLASELEKTGANIEEFPDGMLIEPPKSIKSCQLNPHNDHRTFMAFCVVGLGSREGCLVEGSETVDVSYPDFLRDMRGLSARMDVL